jgi:hypothetical protein
MMPTFEIIVMNGNTLTVQGYEALGRALMMLRPGMVLVTELGQHGAQLELNVVDSSDTSDN